MIKKLILPGALFCIMCAFSGANTGTVAAAPVPGGKSGNLFAEASQSVADRISAGHADQASPLGQLPASDSVAYAPEALAQQQLAAYNARDIEAFLEAYAEDVEVYSYPNQLRYRGKEQMRKRYTALFENTPELHCELKARIVQGNIVIDKERVQFRTKVSEAVAIYHIENHKIQKVYFIK